jgi:hypothetical protein
MFWNRYEGEIESRACTEMVKFTVLIPHDHAGAAPVLDANVSLHPFDVGPLEIATSPNDLTGVIQPASLRRLAVPLGPCFTQIGVITLQRKILDLLFIRPSHAL